MALLTCNYFSEVLGLSTAMTVILPETTAGQYGMDNLKSTEIHKTLFLLHGLSDDHTIWVRRTSIERYAALKGIAVVMPQVHRSFYTDMTHGLRYWTFLTEELPAKARSFFPLSAKREDNYVAGLSMGGYGAMKWALSYPERFAAAASLSGSLDVADPALRERIREDARLIYGEGDINGTPNDLFCLLEQADRHPGPKPKLFQCCGTEDFLYQDNLRFREAVRHTGFEHTYAEGPGDHTWEYWDARIQDVLDWLPLGPREQPEA
ncbi:esterase family protein [Paenibacillus thiaminolyticus]|uniref:Esterase family protein n=1 Tax=Paenibacillus thiaminolyticus TaxID=49283 RepID=A0AAP9J1C9_PANTH|nr:alpha/beta hydrolase family protein [Paenibacillus thiaminolyticus]MCY9538765.1 esterase family protein [Paenibacillus thiaminolyticus]MCY9602768.1 esterase family protein [Paenibacillus thiaminolyticus]MCY9609362.1 esterase family protein [Paenibacillus thiaminolyticus]MCY9616226.1 esterase family protein [Paenibacillus thiaminolyticus]MCY9620092.1 esterase family protein [Paenibacillus thiaminolyticus]